MNTPEWIKSGIYGAVISAFFVGVVGFTWGGWVNGSGEMVDDHVTGGPLIFLSHSGRNTARAIDLHTRLLATPAACNTGSD